MVDKISRQGPGTTAKDSSAVLAKEIEEEDQLSKVIDDLERDHKSWFMGLSKAKLEALTLERFERFGEGEAVQSED